MHKVAYSESILADSILQHLPDNHGAGIPIHCDYIYDQIKEARREDDPRLSQGIWKSKHKIADWPLVISLCQQALSQHSKDLQVIGWLIEGWLVVDGMKGGVHGLRLLGDFCQTFWPVLFPNPLTLHIDDGSLSDDEVTFDQPITVDIDNEKDAILVAEKRQNILDWLDKTLSLRLLHFELSLENDELNLSAITLAHWIDAAEADKRMKRNQVSQYDNKKITLADCRKSFSVCELCHIVKLKNDTVAFLKCVEHLCTRLRHVDLPHAVQFTALISRLKDVLFVLNDALSRRDDYREEEFQSQSNSEHSSNNSSEEPLDRESSEHSCKDEMINDEMTDDVLGQKTPHALSSSLNEKHHDDLSLSARHHQQNSNVDPHDQNHVGALQNQDASFVSHSGSQINANNGEQISITKRADAYQALQQIGLFLHEIDPHSPAPQLIDLILSWEHKTLLQILSDINSGASDAHAMLRQLSHAQHHQYAQVYNNKSNAAPSV